ncbi:serine/threonine protein kinase, CMGC [Marasmius crinis-equi]|uniref:non-specific serine/threonine protein kinase n=1 Tax=Marasmius crinis-equi TaxID=585013 RepID=A0ABR3F215_9AGAR
MDPHLHLQVDGGTGSYSSPASVMTEDEEDWEDYVEGGYHPVQIGETFNNGRYIIVRKLGWGHFSTVWLAKDTKMDRHVALKVVKSAPRYTETALDEIKLLQRLITSKVPPSESTQQQQQQPQVSPALTHPGRSHVISFLDHFRHRGPNGLHVCMVFEVLGENLLGLIRRHQQSGVPIAMVKQIAKQVLLGLDYMHRCCGVIHTDLKPENILISIPNVEDVILAELSNAPNQPSLIGVPPSIGRGGNQTPRSESIAISHSQPLPSPSSSLGSSSSGFGGRVNSSASVDKMAFTMSKIDDLSLKEGSGGKGKGKEEMQENGRVPAPEPTSKKPKPPTKPQPGPSLLSQQAPSKKKGQVEPSATTQNPPPLPAEDTITVKIADLGNATWIEHHFTDDIQTRQYRCPEVILGGKWGPSADIWSLACVLFELFTGGDYLFDPAASSRYSKDEDHIAQIMELMGPIPPNVALTGKYSAEFFNRRGELRHIKKMRYWPLDSVLHEKYLFPQPQADLLANFLTPMLRLDPETRASALECLTIGQKGWLEGVGTVKGQEDVIRRFNANQQSKPPPPRKEKAEGLPTLITPGGTDENGTSGGPIGYILGGVGGAAVLGSIGYAAGGLLPALFGGYLGGLEASLTAGGMKVPKQDQEKGGGGQGQGEVSITVEALEAAAKEMQESWGDAMKGVEEHGVAQPPSQAQTQGKA